MARYLSSERFFTGFGSHNMVRPEPVLRTDDFSDDECKALASSVQRELDELNEITDEQLYFDLGPTADENLEEFVVLKTKWAVHADQIENEYGQRGSTWQYDLHRLNSIAKEHAEVIRGLKREACAQIPPGDRARETMNTSTDWSKPQDFYFIVQMWFDDGLVFDRLEAVTFQQAATVWSVLAEEAKEHTLGVKCLVRLVCDECPNAILPTLEQLQSADAEQNHRAGLAIGLPLPPNDIAARRMLRKQWEELQLHLGDTPPENSDINILVARSLNRLSKQIVADLVTESSASGPVAPAQSPTQPDEAHRHSYRDPDNYWRNVWLYEQRKAGKTNAAILTELSGRAQEFEPIDSENALRSAIDSIALHHQWPVLKGRAGRPRTHGGPATNEAGDRDER